MTPQHTTFGLTNSTSRLDQSSVQYDLPPLKPLPRSGSSNDLKELSPPPFAPRHSMEKQWGMSINDAVKVWKWPAPDLAVRPQPASANAMNSDEARFRLTDLVRAELLAFLLERAPAKNTPSSAEPSAPPPDHSHTVHSPNVSTSDSGDVVINMDALQGLEHGHGAHGAAGHHHAAHDVHAHDDHEHAHGVLAKLVKVLGHHHHHAAAKASPYAHPADLDLQHMTGHTHKWKIDLDELIHSLYTIFSNTKSMVSDGIKSWIDGYIEKAKLMRSDPLDAMSKKGQPHGVGDLVATLVTYPPLIFLAYKGFMAGIEELSEAKEHGPEWAAKCEELRAMAKDLEVLTDQTSPLAQKSSAAMSLQKILGSAATKNAQQQTDAQLAQSQNRLGGQVGAASIASSSGIATGVTVTTFAQLGSMLHAGGFGDKLEALVKNSQAAKIGSMASSAATTFVTSPLAAGGATALGWFARQKSGAKLAQLRPDVQRTQQYLQQVQSRLTDPALHANLAPHAQSLRLKMEKRLGFFNYYHRMNTTLLVCATGYTSAVAMNAGVVAASLVGWEAPVNAATLIAPEVLGAVSGIGMAAGSTQFFIGHGKQDGYDHDFVADHLLLNRHFLAGLDKDLPGDEGLHLRAHFSQTQQTNQAANEHLMRHISRDMDESIDEANLDLEQGVVGDNVPIISMSDVTEWLQEPVNQMQQLDHLLTQLGRNQDYLMHKLALRDEVLPPEHLNAQQIETYALPSGAASQDKATVEQATRRVLTPEAAAALRDEELIAQTMLLRDDLTQLRAQLQDATSSDSPTSSDAGSEKFALALERSMCLLSGKRYNLQHEEVDVDEARNNYAEFLLNSPQKHKKLFSLMMETELQATRIREEIQSN
jgi:hypothetical protein